MSHIKLIAIDMDGTLLTDDKRVTDENERTLQAVIEAGVKVVLCTGRTWPGVAMFLDALPFLNEHDFVILQNGAQTLRLNGARTMIQNQVLDEASKRMILEQAKGRQLQDGQLVAFDRDQLFLIGESVPSELVQRDAAALNTAITPMSETEFLSHPALNKAMVLAPKASLDVFVPQVQQALSDKVSIVRSQPIIVEFLPKDITKASGLAHLAEYLGVQPSEVMAMGDQLNDVEMLEYAGIAVVMGNALPEVKALADFVTLDNQNSGVAHAIEALILQKDENRIQ